MPAFTDPAEATPFRPSQTPPPPQQGQFPSYDGSQASWSHHPTPTPEPFVDENTHPAVHDEQTANVSAVLPTLGTPFQARPSAWAELAPAPSPERAATEIPAVAPPAHVAMVPSAAQPAAWSTARTVVPHEAKGAEPTPVGVRPPNPLEAQHAWPTPASTPAAPTPSSVSEKPAPRQARRTEAYEVIWKGDAPDIFKRARAWATENAKRPQGLLPRLGRAALVEPRARPDAWWLSERSERVATVQSGERSLLDGEGATLSEPAFVVRGVLEVGTTLADRLAALRASLQHLRNQHKAIKEALASTEDIQAELLTPTAVLQAGIDDLLRAAKSAGLKPGPLEESARAALVRARRYREINVLGGDHIVTRWSDALGLSTPQVAYMPLAARANLPLVGVFEARAVVTLHPRQDPEEEGPIALRIHALARSVSAEQLGEPASDAVAS